eukprot:360825-Chlamydomonas_euryale.AAC.2
MKVSHQLATCGVLAAIPPCPLLCSHTCCPIQPATHFTFRPSSPPGSPHLTHPAGPPHLAHPARHARLEHRLGACCAARAAQRDKPLHKPCVRRQQPQPAVANGIVERCDPRGGRDVARGVGRPRWIHLQKHLREHHAYSALERATRAAAHRGRRGRHNRRAAAAAAAAARRADAADAVAAVAAAIAGGGAISGGGDCARRKATWFRSTVRFWQRMERCVQMLRRLSITHAGHT